jgi:formate-dependent nitrite reductase membrane component NrfD
MSPRDMRPAIGRAGGPASWRRAVEGAQVALARRAWGDARWSFLYKPRDSQYATAEPAEGEIAAANRRGRHAPMPPTVQGPIINPPVWTWEVPVYFWLGGMAAGASFVALACDLSGDERSARVARQVSLGAVTLAPPLLISDLGRPGRFLNMLRVFKPRSPMNLGAWALSAFSVFNAAAVGADLLGLRRTAQALGGATAVTGSYLGSYTGVLLATTAVPLWARSRVLLGPIFVATASATGASASRLVLVATGLPHRHPTRRALGTIETGAMATELVLSAINERRIRTASNAMAQGRPGVAFRTARTFVLTGLLLRVLRPRLGPSAHHAASVLYLLAGLLYRYGWVEAGKASARDDNANALLGRGRLTVEDELGIGPSGVRLTSSFREPLSGGRLERFWADSTRRLSLLVDGVLHRDAQPERSGG